MGKRESAIDREIAINNLKAMLTDGQRIYTIIRHVSRSGMRREISVAVIHHGGVHSIDYDASQALGARQGKRGIICNGCGMDMGFDLVNRLEHALGMSFRHSWL